MRSCMASEAKEKAQSRQSQVLESRSQTLASVHSLINSKCFLSGELRAEREVHVWRGRLAMTPCPLCDTVVLLSLCSVWGSCL